MGNGSNDLNQKKAVIADAGIVDQNFVEVKKGFIEVNYVDSITDKVIKIFTSILEEVINILKNVHLKDAVNGFRFFVSNFCFYALKNQNDSIFIDFVTDLGFGVIRFKVSIVRRNFESKVFYVMGCNGIVVQIILVSSRVVWVIL